MTSSSKDYFVVRQAKEKRKKKLLAIISVVSFGGSMLFGAVVTIRQAMRTPQAQPETISVEDSLQQQVEGSEVEKQREQPVVQSAVGQLENQVRGYELVLQREPNNILALERLVNLRLQLGDNQGGMELMKRLVELHPEREIYRSGLATLEQRMGKGSSEN